jgi:hypothetical protein
MTYQQDRLQELVEIRSMMERSSKFTSLPGFAAILAGIYALAGAAAAYTIFSFNPDTLQISETQIRDSIMKLTGAYMLGILTLFLSVGTAMFLSVRKAERSGEKPWTATSRRLLVNMAVPLFAGGILVLIFMAKGLIGLIAPSTLIFYGLALFSASKFTYHEVQTLGIIQLILGLLATCFISNGLLFWAIGFGIVHIIFGIYIHFRYER